MKLVYCKSEDQIADVSFFSFFFENEIADVFSKPFHVNRFEFLKMKLGLCKLKLKNDVGQKNVEEVRTRINCYSLVFCFLVRLKLCYLLLRIGSSISASSHLVLADILALLYIILVKLQCIYCVSN